MPESFEDNMKGYMESQKDRGRQPWFRRAFADPDVASAMEILSKLKKKSDSENIEADLDPAAEAIVDRAIEHLMDEYRKKDEERGAEAPKTEKERMESYIELNKKYVEIEKLQGTEADLRIAMGILEQMYQFVKMDHPMNKEAMDKVIHAMEHLGKQWEQIKAEKK